MAVLAVLIAQPLAAHAKTALDRAARPQPGRIALTFDDLPALSLTADQHYIDDVTTRLVAGLRHHHLIVTAFVIGGALERPTRVEQIANLERWLGAGYDLGNHTYSHETPEQIGVAEVCQDDAQRHEDVLEPVIGPSDRNIRENRLQQR